jgi:hypothetical protein
LQGVSDFVGTVNAMSEEPTNPDKSPVAPDASEPEQPTRPTELAAILLASFCILSVLGVWLIWMGWRNVSVGVVNTAGERCAVYVTLIAGVHLIGYCLWWRQQQGERQKSPVAAVYGPAIRTALLQQGIVLILTALLLDGGQTFSSAVIALVAHWLTVIILVCRRPSSPTEGDVLLVRYGFLLFFFIVLVAGEPEWAALRRYNREAFP